MRVVSEGISTSQYAEAAIRDLLSDRSDDRQASVSPHIGRGQACSRSDSPANPVANLNAPSDEPTVRATWASKFELRRLSVCRAVVVIDR